MWNSTKIKREKQRQDDEQRRLDAMVAAVGMPPNWLPVGRDKKGWVYRWRNGVSYVEHRSGSWYWYTGIKTKHMHENGAFTCPVACAVACELAMGNGPDIPWPTTGRIVEEADTWKPSRVWLPKR